MRQQEVFTKIGGIINELTEQYEYLKTLSPPIDDLELELFAANASFLEDHLNILRKLNATLAAKPVPEKPAVQFVSDDPETNDIDEFIAPAADVQFAEPDTQNEPVQAVAGTSADWEQPDEKTDELPAFEFDLTSAETGSHFGIKEGIMPEDDIVYLEDEPDEMVTAHNQHQVAEEAVAAHQIDLKPDTGNDHFGFVREAETGPIGEDLQLNEADTFSTDPHHEQTIADTLAGNPSADIMEPETEQVPGHYTDDVKPASIRPEQKPLTLNERISAQMGNPITSAPVQPITDLKAAITLNDKMLFVRDLFNGYTLAYSEAIEILNRFSKLEDAERFLAVNYEEKNNWQSKPDTRRKFRELLKRRFSN